MHDDANVWVASVGPAPLETVTEGRQRPGSFLVVGRVHVDVEGLAARGLDRRLDLVDVLDRSPEVEVDAADPVACLRQRERGCLAHPGRCAEDERPALAIIGHEGPPRGAATPERATGAPSLA